MTESFTDTHAAGRSALPRHSAEPDASLLAALPHRPPFLLLDKVDFRHQCPDAPCPPAAENADTNPPPLPPMVARGWWQVPAAHSLLDKDGWLEPVALAEMMAQCVAALGLMESRHPSYSSDTTEAEASNSPDSDGPMGFLAGLRDMRFYVAARAGDELTVTVCETASLGPVSVVQGQVHRNEQLLAEGQCKIFVAR